MNLPHIDINSEISRLDFCAKQMRIEAHNSGQRVETIKHVSNLLARLEDGQISAELAMRWLSRIERAIQPQGKDRSAS